MPENFDDYTPLEIPQPIRVQPGDIIDPGQVYFVNPNTSPGRWAAEASEPIRTNTTVCKKLVKIKRLQNILRSLGHTCRCYADRIHPECFLHYQEGVSVPVERLTTHYGPTRSATQIGRPDIERARQALRNYDPF